MDGKIRKPEGSESHLPKDMQPDVSNPTAEGSSPPATPEQQKTKLKKKLQIFKIFNLITGNRFKLSEKIKGLENKLLAGSTTTSLSEIELEILNLSPSDSEDLPSENEQDYSILEAKRKAEKLNNLLEEQKLEISDITELLDADKHQQSKLKPDSKKFLQEITQSGHPVKSKTGELASKLTRAFADKLGGETGSLTADQRRQVLKFQSQVKLNLGTETKQEAAQNIKENTQIEEGAKSELLTELNLTETPEQPTQESYSNVEDFFKNQPESKPEVSYSDLSKSIVESFGKTLALREKEGESVSRGMRLAIFQNVVLSQSDVLTMTKHEREVLYARIEDEVFTGDTVIVTVDNKRDKLRYDNAKEALEQSIEDRQQIMRQNHLAYFVTASEKSDTFRDSAQTLLSTPSEEITEKDLSDLHTALESTEVGADVLKDIQKAHRDKIIGQVFANYEEKGIQANPEALEQLQGANIEDISIQMTSEGHFTLVFNGTDANKNIIKLTQAKDHNNQNVNVDHAPDAAANADLGIILLNGTTADGKQRKEEELTILLKHEQSHLNRELVKKSQEGTLYKEVSRILGPRKDKDGNLIYGKYAAKIKDILDANPDLTKEEIINDLHNYYKGIYSIKKNIENEVRGKYKDHIESINEETDEDLKKIKLEDIENNIKRTIKQKTIDALDFENPDLIAKLKIAGLDSIVNQDNDTLYSLFALNIESTQTINEQDRLIDELSSEILSWDPTKDLKMHHAGIEEFDKDNKSHQAALNFITFLNNNKGLFEGDPALKELVGRIVEGNLLMMTPASIKNLMNALVKDNDHEWIASDSENIEYNEDDHTDKTHRNYAKDANGWKFSEGDIRRAFSQRYGRISARNPYFRERGTAEPAWWDPTGGKLSGFRVQRGMGAMVAMKRGKEDGLWDEVDLGLRMFSGRAVKHPTGKKIIYWILENIFKIDKDKIKFQPYLQKTLSLQRASGAEHITTVRNNLSMMLQNSGMAKTQLLETLNNVGIAYADHYRGSIEARDKIWTTEQDEHRANPALYHFLQSKNLSTEEEENLKYLIRQETQNGTDIPDDPTYIKKGTMTDSLQDTILMIMSKDGEDDINDKDFGRVRAQFKEMSKTMMDMDQAKFPNGERYTIEHLLRDIKATDDINAMNSDEWNGKKINVKDGEEPHAFVDENTPGEIPNPRKYIWIGGKKTESGGTIDTDRFLVEDARKFASYFMMAKAYNVLQAGSYGDMGSIKIEKDDTGTVKYTANTTIYRTKQDLINKGHPAYTTYDRHAATIYDAAGKPISHSILIQSGQEIPADGNIEIKDTTGAIIDHENLFEAKGMEWFTDASRAEIASKIDDGKSIENFKLYANGASIIAENETMGSEIPIEASERFDQTMMERFFGKIEDHGGEKYIESHGPASALFYYYDWYDEKAKSARFYAEFQHRLSQNNTARDRAQNMKEMWAALSAIDNIGKHTLLAASLWFGIPALLVATLIWMMTGSKGARMMHRQKKAIERQGIELDEEYKQEAELWKKLGSEAMGTTDLEMMIGRHKRIRSRYSKIYKKAEDDIKSDLSDSAFAAISENIGSFLRD